MFFFFCGGGGWFGMHLSSLGFLSFLNLCFGVLTLILGDSQSLLPSDSASVPFLILLHFHYVCLAVLG
jgi:hypothetical protein